MREEKNGTITTWQILLNASDACYSTVSSINIAETVSDKLNVDSQMLKASNGLQRVY